MSWLELVRLRSPEAEANETRAALQLLLDQFQGSPGLLEIALYSDVVLAGDFAMHLVWTANLPAGRTPVGGLIAEQLRGFGLVDHRAWRTGKRWVAAPPTFTGSAPG